MTITIEERLQQYRAVLDDAAGRLGERHETPPIDADVVPIREPRRRGRAVLVGIATAALVGVAIAGIALRDSSDENPAPATQPSTTASVTTLPATTAPTSGPRSEPQPPKGMDGYFLLGERKITYFYVGEPSKLVENDPGRREFETNVGALFWRSGGFESWRSDRAASGELLATWSRFGTDVLIFGNPDIPSNEFAALWQSGNVTMEFRAQARDLARFDSLFGELRSVDRDEFEAALPPGSLDVPEPTVVDEIVVDVPLPPGFDTGPFLESELAGDRLALAEQELIPAIVCKWLDSFYFVGHEDDVSGNLQMGQLALVSTTRWVILDELDETGSVLSERLGRLADAAQRELDGAGQRIARDDRDVGAICPDLD